MQKPANSKRYDLEERTFCFAKDVRTFVRELPRSLANKEDAAQLVRSSGSVGANYIEANGSLGKKDFLMRIRISRKEAKESCFWLRLIQVNNDLDLEARREKLIRETTELTFIFNSILKKSQ